MRLGPVRSVHNRQDEIHEPPALVQTGILCERLSPSDRLSALPLVGEQAVHDGPNDEPGDGGHQQDRLVAVPGVGPHGRGLAEDLGSHGPAQVGLAQRGAAARRRPVRPVRPGGAGGGARRDGAHLPQLHRGHGGALCGLSVGVERRVVHHVAGPSLAGGRRAVTERPRSTCSWHPRNNGTARSVVELG